ncbi:MAG: phosphatidylglycerophosphatase A [Mariprofundaceae bacterium]|nr:phosphatidylglycerophosphatase A [Mariprofundaceae bacterium]
MTILPKLFVLRFLASGLASGWLPKAPGTWGSLAALFPAYCMLLMADVCLLWWASLAVSVLGFVVCYFLLPALVAKGEDHDPGWIVIDEWAGQWLCIAIVVSFFPTADLWLVLLLSFVFFRAFDIIKPFPIKQLESWGADWFSIMFDDLVAGVMAAAVVLGVLLSL